MIVKVVLGTMQKARKLVSIAESIPYDVELCDGHYVVDAKSMLGVLGLPAFDRGELRIHTDNEAVCERILWTLSEEDLLADTDDTVSLSIYDITTFGEIIIDFTSQGLNEDGQMLYARNPGGAPANVAVAAKRLGAHTAFLGKAGKDMHGEYLRDVLDREKVDTKGLILDEKHFTTLVFVEISDSVERSFSFARKPGADTQMEKEEVDIDVVDHTHIFHVGSLSLTDQPARDTTFYAVKRAKAKGSIISYDPNYRASLWSDEETAREHMRSLIPYVDMMKISDEETELLTGFASAPEAAAALFQQGVKVAAVTLGADGAYIYCKDGGLIVPGSAPSQVQDTNGAGDSFWAGFLYKVCTCGKRPEDLGIEDLADFARFGNAVASLCIEKKGAIPAMPDLQQVEARLHTDIQ